MLDLHSSFDITYDIKQDNQYKMLFISVFDNKSALRAKVTKTCFKSLMAHKSCSVRGQAGY